MSDRECIKSRLVSSASEHLVGARFAFESNVESWKRQTFEFEPSNEKIKTALKWLESNDKRRSLFRRPLGFSCADGGFSRDHPKRQIEKGELQRAPIGIPVRIRSGSFGSD